MTIIENSLPVFVIPMKIDTDVVASVTLWLLLNYENKEAARQGLLQAEIKVVSFQYRHDCHKAELDWPNRPVLVFDIGEEYIPGKVFDHHQWGGALSAASLVLEEYKDKQLDAVSRQSFERLIGFVNDNDNYQSFFDTNQILLERIVGCLKLNNVSILNNSAYGPAHLPNVLAKLTKGSPDKSSPEQAREVLLLGFDKILDWMDEEQQIANLSASQRVDAVSDLVDVVSVTSKLLPERLRFLYNRMYRLQQKKFYVMAAVIEYPFHRQLVVSKMIPGALANFHLKRLATWLVYKFGFKYEDIKVLKNNNLISVKIPDGMKNFYLRQVADYIRHNVVIKEDVKLAILTKFFKSVFSFWEFHIENETLLKETFGVFGRLLRVVQSVDNLQPFLVALEKMEENAQARSDSYPVLPVIENSDLSEAEVVVADGPADSSDDRVDEELELRGVFVSSTNKKM